MTLSLENHSLIYKSGLRFKGDSAYEHSTLGHPIRQERSYQNESAYKQGKLQAKSVQNKSVNTSIKTTAAENCNGRLSFKGSAVDEAGNKIGGPIMQAIAKNKLTQKFVKMADQKMLVFDALVALAITCTLRPLSIMLLPSDKKDVDKNKKAAAHSISSGVIGYVFSLALTTPLQAAFKKVKGNHAKYLTKKGQEFFAGKIKFDSKKSPKPNNKKDIAETTEKFFSRIAEMCFVPIRAAMTVAFLPVVDKAIISKVFGPSEEKKQPINPAIYFKGGELPTDSFKKFREGKAKIA